MKRSITTNVVQRIIADTIPQWKHMIIKPVAHPGWDNITFHLGEHMIIRIPRSRAYAPKIKKEFQWLPVLAPLLPHAISTPLIMGKPSKHLPLPWGVYTWLTGEAVASAGNIDLNQLAYDLASFLKALHTIDTTGGPLAGKHNFYRGGSLMIYTTEVEKAVSILKNKIDVAAVKNIWDSAITTEWHQPAVWIHGDIAVGNLLVQDGKLSAVIDWGGLGVGDPACDLAIAWTLFTGESRELFRETVSVDTDTWNRGRAWALWKALIIAAGTSKTNAQETQRCWNTLSEISAHKKMS